MIKRITALAVSAFIFYSCTTDGPPEGIHEMHSEAKYTAYTARLPGDGPEVQAVLLTNVVYPATREDNAVGAIILTHQNPLTAYMAMHRVTHMPVNAPLLYLDKAGRISEETLKEMERLHPDGVMQDARRQVYILGYVEPEEVEKITKGLKYSVRIFDETDPLGLSDELDRWQAALKSDHPDEVVLSAIDHPDGLKHGIGEMGWNAHMGKGFAWVYKDSVPEITKKILRRRLGRAYMYLTGPSEVISDKVAKELSEFGLVRRITGSDIYHSSAVNAGYKDYGRNFGWWWGWDPRSFGWGIAQAGHNYIIGNPDDLLSFIPAAVLGHMGKHGPMLLVTKDSIPGSVKNYLKMVKPFPTGPHETILNFAWIIGDTASVSDAVQMEIDRYLSPFPLKKETDSLMSSQMER